MNKLYIKDLKVGDVLVNHKFAIKDFAKKVGKTNNEYYTVVLSDKTGFIDAKIWSNSFAECSVDQIKIGNVVNVTGKIDEYNSTPQIILEKMIITEEYNAGDFLSEGTRDANEIFNSILETVDLLEDTDIKNLILDIFKNEDLLKKYKQVPAGEFVHHSFVGGLLEHVYEMLEFAKTAKILYPDINFSELAFGVIFHDIGKIEELGVNGVVMERTLPGYLIGHLGQGLLLVNKHFPENFDVTKKNRLLHMILSHHGEKDKGSPIQPMTLEALVLSEIDTLSSRVGIYYTNLSKGETDEKGLTAYSKYLGASFLVHKDTEEP
ncbi:hypothetical protein COV24_01295 [candidate division WWE3 bacterium CG10_big_fil_rev_8_21_14_0_10_32_10]|uniref:HD domain-containing protein n=1 Tax=candidate division WWE3 bacterium CG10_big_fil_rev_8_21_14_0_10_32_10 TaxID=1975090 RepID=A0A2H0RCA4_UNCKA|nr:MAG: hypothetical protein COV24_01295 [candidate division WWE3 bacterium CG10_big_fil_rev_8_21_14_0_10_32_10]